MSSTLKGYKREGGCSLRSSNGIAVFDETYSYIVETTSNTENYASVVTTAGLPLPGVSVSPTGYGICRTIAGNFRPENPKIWDFTAEFSSEVEENQNNQDPRTDPLVWKPIYETKFERIQEVVTRDKSGNSIANSAGQAFENGLTVSRFIPVWEFFQFESAMLTDEQLADRNETVNSDVFKGRAVKTLLLTVVTSTVGFYYGRKIRLTKYQLRYNKRNWRNKRLDVGTIFISSGNPVPYTDNAGNVIRGSLNGSGGKQTAGTAPAVREFDQYDDLAFGTFLRV